MKGQGLKVISERCGVTGKSLKLRGQMKKPNMREHRSGVNVASFSPGVQAEGSKDRLSRSRISDQELKVRGRTLGVIGEK